MFDNNTDNDNNNNNNNNNNNHNDTDNNNHNNNTNTWKLEPGSWMLLPADRLFTTLFQQCNKHPTSEYVEIFPRVATLPPTIIYPMVS